MADAPDDFEKLLTDVRKTISDNRQFLEKLLDETTDVSSGDDSDTAIEDGEFEEL